MNDNVYCFSSKNRRCHHDDYFLLISKIRNAINVKSFGLKFKLLFSKKPIVFLDIDAQDLLFFPIMLLRSIWGAKAIAISVRTEYLYLDKNYEKESDKSFKYKQKLKQIIFLLIKHFSLTKVYSIHKNTKYDKLVLHYTHGNFYDIQLWDLKYLNFKESMPKELINLKLDLDNYVLLAGKLDERRSKSEFIKFIKNNSDIKFIIAGIIDDNDINILKDKPNLILINRFISNEELFFLMKYCKSIYSYYSNYRPSGFFGRSVQLNRQIIVKNNSFLSENFKEYKKLISISNLSELNADLLCMPMSHDESFIYDDYNFFSKLILLL